MWPEVAVASQRTRGISDRCYLLPSILRAPLAQPQIAPWWLTLLLTCSLSGLHFILKTASAVWTLLRSCEGPPRVSIRRVTGWPWLSSASQAAVLYSEPIMELSSRAGSSAEAVRALCCIQSSAQRHSHILGSSSGRLCTTCNPGLLFLHPECPSDR